MEHLDMTNRSIKNLEKHPHSWGGEYWLHNDIKYCMKVLEFSRGTKGSRHYHPVKEETMLVVSGKFRISGVGGSFETYGVGDFITFTAGTPHQIKCLKSGWIVEASTQHDDKDVFRIQAH